MPSALKLHRYFGFPTSSWTGEQERTDGSMLIPKSGTGHLDRFGFKASNGFILTKDQHLQTIAKGTRRVAIALRNALLRNARGTGHYGLNIRHLTVFSYACWLSDAHAPLPRQSTSIALSGR